MQRINIKKIIEEQLSKGIKDPIMTVEIIKELMTIKDMSEVSCEEVLSWAKKAEAQ